MLRLGYSLSPSPNPSHRGRGIERQVDGSQNLRDVEYVARSANPGMTPTSGH